mmetsp:Transcript_36408/g.55885  ORF Transcript_36408/g.55885 Transcript_36408/m.55885 type:complete len:125 (+) Transcript_36408:58-432(+)|eukprot:CAMPEP_0170481690 /NCGR_PEP_ID=MMETSP0208-20121228/2039_1 /TAXON_ID=197538 /ORGANISM="Strombidium inclinatum, Strain S3" /LENGTH=124 /DNA_ID=CAMNT_0010754441 /DNA_START=1818 /DNA_END=2192 /DNA_ORIENTATION=-
MFLKYELLAKPRQESLFHIELNRLEMNPRDLQSLHPQTANQEFIMLTGLLLIAKFLIVKILVDPVRFRIASVVNEQQYENLKMLATVIYFSGIREFVSKSVNLKKSNFTSDSDGGMSHMLYDEF